MGASSRGLRPCQVAEHMNASQLINHPFACDDPRQWLTKSYSIHSLRFQSAEGALDQ